MSDPVRQQYELLPYPGRDPRDEAQRLIEGSPSHLLELNHYLFAGARDFSKPFRALVAGGGTGDGLIMLAQHLADRGSPAEIVYLDLSKASRAIAEQRARVRGLSNIKFMTGSLLDLPTLGLGRFDYIDCCGVLHHLADLGVRLEFVPTNWDTLGAGIAADKYDVVASGVTMTLERLKSVAFSDPYLDSPLVPLILAKDEGKYATWRDMDQEGVKLAVMAGTSAEESAKKNFTKAEVIPITAPALDYQELLAGRVTAAITDTVFIRKALSQYQKEFAVVDPDHPIEGQPISMMTVQGDQVWLNWINTWIKLRQQSGYFDSLFQKWIAG